MYYEIIIVDEKKPIFVESDSEREVRQAYEFKEIAEINEIPKDVYLDEKRKREENK